MAAVASTAATAVVVSLVVPVVTGQLVERARLDVVAATDTVARELASGIPVEDVSIAARTDGTHIRIRDRTTGEVVAASAVVRTEVRTSPGERDVDIDVISSPDAFPADSRLHFSAAVRTPAGATLLVEAARDDDFVDITRTTLYRTGFLGGTVGVIVTALAAWGLAGRALTPVRSMADRAAGIGDRNRSDRIPVPPTGDEIARLATVLNEMLDRFEATRRREEALVSDVAHELRTPLAALQARLDTEREAETGHDGRSRPGLEAASTQVRRLTAIVADILRVAQLDGGEATTAERRPLELAALVRSTLAAYGPDEISLVVDRPHGWVDGDPEMLARVVTNLIDNALRHGGTSARVTVSDDGGRCSVRVDDDGPGIALEDRQRVFDRFVQLDPSRRGSGERSGGTGLGLAIVRAAVEHHGGRVSISAGDRGGAAVTVELPRVPRPA